MERRRWFVASRAHRGEVAAAPVAKPAQNLEGSAGTRPQQQGPAMDKINQRIATELGVGAGHVAAAVELLGEGATVPFIARYRKERTGGIDDTQLRKLEERLGYLRELEDRRAT